MSELWWKSAVIYQIYPRSFCDSNGDGIGDLDGVRRHLDHLELLGVDAIWLSPFFTSPMKDYGYDVADYCDVDPLFGDLGDFDRLVDEAHSRGIKVLIDWVPNHTSDQHPWFVESRWSRDNPKADWYWWRDGSPEVPPNNWVAAFTGAPAWTWDETRRQWYLHLFLSEQPDLNWRNPEVVAAMHDTLRFWLDRGVDGFRVDVVHLLGKEPALADHPIDRESGRLLAINDYEDTHEIIRGVRRVLEEYDGDRMMVGEVYILSTRRVATYYGNGDELHLAFNFPPLYAPWEATAWRRRIDRVVEELGPRDAWPSWVLSNHDNPRHRTRYRSEDKARAAAVLLLTLRGTPFLYAGEELGLEDAVILAERTLDPGGRDGCRAPIPWTSAPDHGWGVEDAWLPWPPDARTRNAETEMADETSVLALYRRLLAARKASPALQMGSFQWLAAPPAVLAFERTLGDDRRIILVNYSEEAQVVETPTGCRIDVASDGSREGQRWENELSPLQAVILR